MLSVVIGLAAAIIIGGLAIILALRIPCGTRRKRKEITQGAITGEGSPGPSDKSIGSKDVDGNESDEKNPDIIPDTIDSDDQVIKYYFCYFFELFKIRIIIIIITAIIYCIIQYTYTI